MVAAAEQAVERSPLGGFGAAVAALSMAVRLTNNVYGASEYVGMMQASGLGS